MNKTKLFSALVLTSVLGLMSCKGAKGDADKMADSADLAPEAQMLTLKDFDGYYVAEIVNPWQTDRLLQTLVLVNRDADIDRASLPDGVVIEVPLRSSLVYSSAHAGIIDEMGKVAAITGVCDSEFYKMPKIVEGLANGSIVDAGNSMSPSIEKIIALAPEAIIVSPFQNAGHGAIEQLKIPIVEMADYMELTPLGRAEWIKLIGILYGCRDRAEEIYASVCSDYKALTDTVADVKSRPKIINENITNGIWYMAGGHSYMARMFADAGGNYPWADDDHAGSLELDFATVYDVAHDADIWMTKTVGYDMTLDELRKIYTLNERFKAFKEGNVYNCNTTEAPLFEEFPFHPERLLRDFVIMFHPELMPGASLRYYKKVK
ncbi:MAG: ABC transporter substrate-binding protein [Muribaculaceae bacterium]|nr:ABC transporter substrate-binding protein [Muribaculaceae bacterium]